MPNPEWLEHWLDRQIKFGPAWESCVVERILHNLRLLPDRSFCTVQELNKYRKELACACTHRSRSRATTGCLKPRLPSARAGAPD